MEATCPAPTKRGRYLQGCFEITLTAKLLNDSRAAQKFTYSSFRQNMLAFIESEILPDIIDSPVSLL